MLFYNESIVKRSTLLNSNPAENPRQNQILELSGPVLAEISDVRSAAYEGKSSKLKDI